MPEFTQLTFAGTYGVSNYDALVLSLEKRFSGGLTFLAGFSWQKSAGPGLQHRLRRQPRRLSLWQHHERLRRFRFQPESSVHRLVQLPASRAETRSGALSLWEAGSSTAS